MAYLTPDTLPTATRCGVLIYPDSDEFAANIRGALQELTFSHNFIVQGTLTPDETAEAYVPMFDGFCFNVGVCRVIGEIIAFSGATSPDAKWLPCDGASLLRADYPDLFAVIGTDYGSVDGTHFNLPDLRGRAISGIGTGTGLTYVALGDSYGEQDHQLSIGELAGHSHVDVGHAHTEGNAIPALLTIGAGVPSPSAVPGIGITGGASANISSTGGDNPHNTVGPRLGCNYLIVALQ